MRELIKRLHGEQRRPYLPHVSEHELKS